MTAPLNDKIELHDGGYRVTLTATELGHLQAGLIDLAKFYEQNTGGSTDAWFKAQAAEVRALHDAIDPRNVR